VAGYLYRSGLRLMEAVTLRVKDLDFERRSGLVRGGKGAKDRITMMAAGVTAGLVADLDGLGLAVGVSGDAALPRSGDW
jgi:integrase